MKDQIMKIEKQKILIHTQADFQVEQTKLLFEEIRTAL